MTYRNPPSNQLSWRCSIENDAVSCALLFLFFFLPRRVLLVKGFFTAITKKPREGLLVSSDPGSSY